MSTVDEHIRRLMTIFTSSTRDDEGGMHPFLEGWDAIGVRMGTFESGAELDMIHLDFVSPINGSDAVISVHIPEFTDLLENADASLFSRTVSEAVHDELTRWPEGESGESTLVRADAPKDE